MARCDCSPDLSLHATQMEHEPSLSSTTDQMSAIDSRLLCSGVPGDKQEER